MSTQTFCQSCSMPLDSNEIRGTEKDGSKSSDYCKYCYQDGQFTTPSLTLPEMEKIVVTEMEKQHIPQNIVNMAVASLPQLKRWKTN